MLPWPAKPAEQDSDLWELYFWGSTAEFFDHNVLDACQDAVATAGGPDPTKPLATGWLTLKSESTPSCPQASTSTPMKPSEPNATR